MAREFSKKFYNSKAWIKCRESYKQSKFGLCERCGMPGEEVHHKTYLTPNNINDANTTLNWSNLELLCMSCHTKEHMSKYGALGEGYSFSPNGELVYTPPYRRGW